jgi:signal transduction histidine kinase
MENMEKHLDNPEFLQDSTHTLRSAVERMKRTIGKLRRRPAEWIPKQEPILLSSLLANLLRESGLSKHPSVRVETALQDDAEIVGDREETERLFLNLFQNAVEAMPEGGVLNVSCEVLPEAVDRSRWIRVCVRDSGRGMTADFLKEKLFRPFASTRKEGLGLGLFTCREIVARQGGRIEVDSKPGRGTRFHIEFPQSTKGVTRT